jgi:hypothetical protein
MILCLGTFADLRGKTMIFPTDPASDDFYARSLDRIQSFMLVLGIAALITVYIVFGWRIGMGFALGATIAYLNFHWLKKVVAGLAELTIGSGTPASSRGVVHRFLLRYFLMAIIAFVILTVSRESLYGLFAGLFLPVAAILCEAAYEAYVALIRKM